MVETPGPCGDPTPATAEAARIGPPALEALRLRGAAQFDPVRWHFLESLLQRLEGHPSEPVRVLLQARFEQALQDFSQRLVAATTAGGRSGVEASARPADSPLAALNRTLRQLAAPSALASPLAEDPAMAAVLVRPELKSVAGFRAGWSGWQAGRRLSRSMAQGPEQAGPFNSHRLMLRSLAWMQELSPAYLQAFMAQADLLLWLEKAGQRPAAPKPKAVRRRR